MKDISARLPYGVKVQCEDYLFTFDKDHMGIGMLYKDFKEYENIEDAMEEIPETEAFVLEDDEEVTLPREEEE